MRSARLHVETELGPGAAVGLDAGRAHYLVRVLRLGPGAMVRVFNARDGEWRATVEMVGRREVRLRVGDRLRPAAPVHGPTLYVAPPRRSRFEWLVEKATELGVGRIAPVLTARSVARPHNSDRLRAIMVEAAEQCERLDVPELAPLRPLREALDARAGGPLVFADEAGGTPVLDALGRVRDADFLVGPEGGFDAAERSYLRSRGEVVAVSLGPRILRVETAALALLACAAAVTERNAESVT